MHKYLFLLIICIPVIFGCAVSKNIPAMTVKLRSENGNGVKLSAMVAGVDGRTLDGARVVAVNPAGTAILLNFNTINNRFEGYFDGEINGNYSVRCGGISEYDDVELHIKHFILQDKPVIEMLRDVTGSSALNAEQLDVNTDIILDFNDVNGANRYRIVIYGNNGVVYSLGVVNSNGIVPAKSLLSGSNYFICVEAQFITGDPLFEKESYSSESVVSGDKFYFRTK